jgi:hypothetical protein
MIIMPMGMDIIFFQKKGKQEIKGKKKKKTSNGHH